MSGEIIPESAARTIAASDSTISAEGDPHNEKSADDQPLQPPDGGRGWLVVFGSFLVSLINNRLNPCQFHSTLSHNLI